MATWKRWNKMMGYHATLFRLRLDELKQLHEFFEDQVVKHESKLEDIIDEQQENAKTQDEKDTIYQIYEDEYNNYKDVFPGTFRYAMIILLYSLLEHKMGQLCKVIEAKTDPRIHVDEFIRQKGRISDIQKSWFYIKEIGDINLRENSIRWKKLQKNFRSVRNSIVHDNGVVTTQKLDEMKTTLKKLKNSKLDQHRKILLEEEFVLDFMKTIHDFILFEVLNRKDLRYIKFPL
jgi:hypothetical protein